MPTHSETKRLPYTAQQMYDLVADVASYPKFLPWNSAARIRSRTPIADNSQFIATAVQKVAMTADSETSASPSRRPAIRTPAIKIVLQKRRRAAVLKVAMSFERSSSKSARTSATAEVGCVSMLSLLTPHARAAYRARRYALRLELRLAPSASP